MNKVVIYVEGMSCGHCVNSVEGALTKLPGVSNAKVNLKDKNVTVEYDNGVNVDTLKKAIEDQGYDVI